MRVTSSRDELREYLTHTKYNTFTDAFVPLAEYPGAREHIAAKKTVWYPWRRVEGGVVYGGAGWYNFYVEAGWQQGSGTLPHVPMAPFDAA